MVINGKKGEEQVGEEAKESVMINCICRLDKATGFPDIWSNIILGTTMRIFLDEINIQNSRLSQADCLP